MVCFTAVRCTAALLIGYVLLVLHSTVANAPTTDEPRRLIAGLRAWETGEFDLNRGNPPLVGLVAALGLRSGDTALSMERGDGRHPLSMTVEKAWSEQLAQLVRAGRWRCLPLCLLGAWVCWRWASEASGAISGLVAVALWCLDPNVLAHGSLVTADIPAAAMGAVACYTFWKWLRKPSGVRAALAGVALGLAEITKFVWLLLYPLLPVTWLIWRVSLCGRSDRGSWWSEGLQLGGILLLSVYLTNVAYAFEGTFTAIGECGFESRSVGGVASEESSAAGQTSEDMSATGSGAWWASIPVPLPVDYVRGIYEIAHVVEPDDQWCYLGGEWKQGGWWYYYLYGLGVKLPAGTLLLFAVALGLTVRGWLVGSRETRDKRREPEATDDGSRTADKAITWRDDMVLLVPIVVILVWVTWATFNHQYHVRYAFPVLPFVFIFASRVAVVFEARGQKSEVGEQKSGIRGRKSEVRGQESGINGRVSRLIARMRRGRFWWQVTVAGALAWNVVSVARVYPHCLSYFNELAGGPERGHEHLLSSNIDWGQDLLFLKDWYEEHPEARPFYLAYYGPMEPAVLGIEYERIPAARELAVPVPAGTGSDARAGMTDATELMGSEGRVGNPSYIGPGWYALSIRPLKDRTGEYAQFMKLTPAAMAGYSIYIYHVTEADAERLRREIGVEGSKSRRVE